jgi:hypothetical protein
MTNHSRLAPKPCTPAAAWETQKFLAEKPPVRNDSQAGPDLAEQFRHSGWAPFRRRVMAAMAAVPAISERRASSFRGCGCDAYVEWRWVSSAMVGKEWRIRSTKCHDRFCIPCSNERGSRIRSSLLQHMYQRQNMKLLTLTLRASSDNLTTILDRLTRCFRLLRNRPIWKKNVSGGCAIIETKVGQGSGEWHAHFHVILESKFISHATLADEWEKITGDSRIVDIRPMQAKGGGVQYITKYVTKAGDPSIVLSPKHLQEALIAFHSRRLISTLEAGEGCNSRRNPMMTWYRLQLGSGRASDASIRYSQTPPVEIIPPLPLFACSDAAPHVRPILPPSQWMACDECGKFIWNVQCEGCRRFLCDNCNDMHPCTGEATR